MFSIRQGKVTFPGSEMKQKYTHFCTYSFGSAEIITKSLNVTHKKIFMPFAIKLLTRK